MKYQFGRNSKKLSSEQIKGHMNFETVATGAKAFAGAKLVSSVLKSSFFTPAAATVGTIATVATLAVVGPALLETEEPQTPEPAKIEVFEPQETVDSLNTSTLIVEQQEAEEKVKEVPKMAPASISKPKPVVEQKDEEQPHIAPQPNEPMENTDVFVKARPLPDFESFLAFISSELEYPEKARMDSTEGFVRVRFTVNQRGIAEEFKINKSLGELFDNEAIRVLKMYQNWEPASFNGQAVESRQQINIQFEFEKPAPKDIIKYY